VLAAAGLSCGKKAPGTFTSRDGSFSTRLPAGWEVKENQENVAVIATDPSSQSIFRPNVIVALESVPDSEDLQAYMRMNMDSIRSVLTGFTMIGESALRISDSPAVRAEYSYTLGPVRVRVISVYVIRNGKAFVLNCSGMDDDYGALRPVFEGVISAFVLN